jgi:hypothetical protein
MGLVTDDLNETTHIIRTEDDVLLSEHAVEPLRVVMSYSVVGRRQTSDCVVRDAIHRCDLRRSHKLPSSQKE